MSDTDDVDRVERDCKEPELQDRELLRQIFELLHAGDEEADGGGVISTFLSDKSWTSDVLVDIDDIVRPLFEHLFPKIRVSVVIHRDSIFPGKACHEIPTSLAAAAVTRDPDEAHAIAKAMHECGLSMVPDVPDGED